MAWIQLSTGNYCTCRVTNKGKHTTRRPWKTLRSGLTFDTSELLETRLSVCPSSDGGDGDTPTDRGGLRTAWLRLSAL